VRGLDPTWVSSWGALLVRQFLVYPRSRLPTSNNGTDPDQNVGQLVSRPPVYKRLSHLASLTRPAHIHLYWLVCRQIWPQNVILPRVALARRCKSCSIKDLQQEKKGITVSYPQGCLFLNFAKTPSVWALAKLCNGAGIGILQYASSSFVELSPSAAYCARPRCPHIGH
jgi:hypothetical protein